MRDSVAYCDMLKYAFGIPNLSDLPINILRFLARATSDANRLQERFKYRYIRIRRTFIADLGRYDLLIAMRLNANAD